MKYETMFKKVVHLFKEDPNTRIALVRPNEFKGWIVRNFHEYNGGYYYSARYINDKDWRNASDCPPDKAFAGEKGDDADWDIYVRVPDMELLK